MKRNEYPAALNALGLSLRQVEQLRSVIEDLSLHVHIKAAAARRANDSGAEAYYDGKVDGLNAIDRFLRGDMDAHDEFED